MSKITKHDGEEEGEGDDGVGRGIHLAVGGHAVSVYKRLETLGELVRAVVRRRVLEGLHAVKNRRHRATAALGSPT